MANARANTQAVSRRQRINTEEVVVLILFALICDVLSLIPIVDTVLAFIVPIVFGIAFYMMGVNVMSARKMITAIVAEIIEVVPILSALPGYTLGVIVIIYITHLEDRTGVNISGAKAKGSLKSTSSETKNFFNTVKGAKNDNLKNRSRASISTSTSQGVAAETRTENQVTDNTSVLRRPTNNNETITEGTFNDEQTSKNYRDEINSFDFSAENAVAERERTKGKINENVPLEQMLRIAAFYDQKSVELRGAKREDEANEYALAAGDLRRKYKEGMEHLEEIEREKLEV